jgi:restriction endonuclease Mrr
LLKYARDGKEHRILDVVEKLAEEFRLSEEERKELLPSGQQAVFKNRVGWASTYLILVIHNTRFKKIILCFGISSSINTYT